MNSEELEQSLRTEFDGFLKGVLADMRQEIAGLKGKVDAEFEKHKSQIDTIFQDFSARVENDRTIDEGFRESIVEHLRLARDEGARITAEAISEAEKLREESAPAADFSEMRDAINDISSKDSQSEILKSLVNHAARYTPRGAFFIVKNEHFVGWRVFGTEGQTDEQAVREVFIPIQSSTVLSEAVNSLETAEGVFGKYSDDAVYLNKLDFGKPDRMYAVPLVARGRGVAVLYADYGQEGTRVDVEALETLVRVAGLTVELLAASRGGKPQSEAKPENSYNKQVAATSPQGSFAPKNRGFSSYQGISERDEEYSPATQTQSEFNSFQPTESFQAADEAESFDFSYTPAEQQEEFSAGQSNQFDQSGFATSDYSSPEFESEEPKNQTENEYQSFYDNTPSWNPPAEDVSEYSSDFSTQTDTQEESPVYEASYPQNDFSIPATEGYSSSSSDYQFESQSSLESQETPQFGDYSDQPTEAPQFDSSSYGTNGSYNAPATEDFSTPGASFDSSEYQSEQSSSFAQPTAQSPAPAPIKTRFSERSTDLPIEVTDEERRLHNDARRFARLLVSEIKLYNEQKVTEGRESQDLYERLREAIDRSREMYDKRVQPPVASKFDYFHYELVNTLAEGDEAKLGTSYPGAEV